MASNFFRYFSKTPRQDGPPGEKTLVVRKQRCPENHRCPSVPACPFGALSQSGHQAPLIDYDKCTGCGKCTRYCMPRALVMQGG